MHASSGKKRQRKQLQLFLMILKMRINDIMIIMTKENNVTNLPSKFDELEY